MRPGYGHRAAIGICFYGMVAFNYMGRGTAFEKTAVTAPDTCAPAKVIASAVSPAGERDPGSTGPYIISEYMCHHADLVLNDDGALADPMWNCAHSSFTDPTINITACHLPVTAASIPTQETSALVGVPTTPFTTAPCDTQICVPPPCSILDINYQTYSIYRNTAADAGSSVQSMFGRPVCGSAFGRGVTGRLRGDPSVKATPADDSAYYYAAESPPRNGYAHIDGTDDPALLQWRISASQCMLGPNVNYTNLDEVNADPTALAVTLVTAVSPEAAKEPCGAPPGDDDAVVMNIWSHDSKWGPQQAYNDAMLSDPTVLSIEAAITQRTDSRDTYLKTVHACFGDPGARDDDLNNTLFTKYLQAIEPPIVPINYSGWFSAYIEDLVDKRIHLAATNDTNASTYTIVDAVINPAEYNGATNQMDAIIAKYAYGRCNTFGPNVAPQSQPSTVLYNPDCAQFCKSVHDPTADDNFRRFGSAVLIANMINPLPTVPPSRGVPRQLSYEIGKDIACHAALDNLQVMLSRIYGSSTASEFFDVNAEQHYRQWESRYTSYISLPSYNSTDGFQTWLSDQLAENTVDTDTPRECKCVPCGGRVPAKICPLVIETPSNNSTTWCAEGNTCYNDFCAYGCICDAKKTKGKTTTYLGGTCAPTHRIQQMRAIAFVKYSICTPDYNRIFTNVGAADVKIVNWLPACMDACVPITDFTRQLLDIMQATGGPSNAFAAPLFDTKQPIAVQNVTTAYFWICFLSASCTVPTADNEIPFDASPRTFRAVTSLRMARDRISTSNLPVVPIGEMVELDSNVEYCGETEPVNIRDYGAGIIQEQGDVEYKLVACSIYGYCDDSGTFTHWLPDAKARQLPVECCACTDVHYMPPASPVGDTSVSCPMYASAGAFVAGQTTTNCTVDNSKAPVWWSYKNSNASLLEVCCPPTGEWCNHPPTAADVNETIAGSYPFSSCIMKAGDLYAAVCADGKPDPLCGFGSTSVVDSNIAEALLKDPTNADRLFSGTVTLTANQRGIILRDNANTLVRGIQLQMDSKSSSSYPPITILLDNTATNNDTEFNGNRWELPNQVATDVTDPCIRRQHPLEVGIKCEAADPTANSDSDNIGKSCAISLASGWDNVQPYPFGCAKNTPGTQKAILKYGTANRFNHKCYIPNDMKSFKPQNPCAGKDIPACSIKNGTFDYNDAHTKACNGPDSRLKGVHKCSRTSCGELSYLWRGRSSSTCMAAIADSLKGPCSTQTDDIGESTPHVTGYQKCEVFGGDGGAESCVPCTPGTGGCNAIKKTGCDSKFNADTSAYCSAYDAADIFKFCTPDTMKSPFWNNKAGSPAPQPAVPVPAEPLLRYDTSPAGPNKIVFAQCCTDDAFHFNVLQKNSNAWPGTGKLNVNAHYIDTSTRPKARATNDEDVKLIDESVGGTNVHGRKCTGSVSNVNDDNRTYAATKHGTKNVYDFWPGNPVRDAGSAESKTETGWSDGRNTENNCSPILSKVAQKQVGIYPDGNNGIDYTVLDGGIIDGTSPRKFQMSGHTTVTYGDNPSCGRAAPALKIGNGGKLGAMYAAAGDRLNFLTEGNPELPVHGRPQFVADNIKWEFLSYAPYTPKSYLYNDGSVNTNVLLHDFISFAFNAMPPMKPGAKLSDIPDVGGDVSKAPYASASTCDCGKASPVYACTRLDAAGLAAKFPDIKHWPTFEPNANFDSLVCGWSWDNPPTQPVLDVGLYIPSAPGSGEFYTVERDPLGNADTADADLETYFTGRGAPAVDGPGETSPLVDITKNIGGDGEDFNPTGSGVSANGKVYRVKYPGTCLRYPYARTHRAFANGKPFASRPEINGGLSAIGDEALYGYCDFLPAPSGADQYVFCENDRMSVAARAEWCQSHPEARYTTFGFASRVRVEGDACKILAGGNRACVFIAGDINWKTPSAFWALGPDTTVIVAPFSFELQWGFQPSATRVPVGGKSIQEALQENHPKVSVGIDISKAEFDVVASLGQSPVTTVAEIIGHLTSLHTKIVAMNEDTQKRSGGGCASGVYIPAYGEAGLGRASWDRYYCGTPSDIGPTVPSGMAVTTRGSILMSGVPYLPIVVDVDVKSGCRAATIDTMNVQLLDIAVVGSCAATGLAAIPFVVGDGDVSNTVLNITTTHFRASPPNVFVAVIGYNPGLPRSIDAASVLGGSTMVNITVAAGPARLADIAVIRASGTMVARCGPRNCTILTQTLSPDHPFVTNGTLINVTAFTALFGAALERQFLTHTANFHFTLLIVAILLTGVLGFAVLTIETDGFRTNARPTPPHNTATTNNGEDKGKGFSKD